MARASVQLLHGQLQAQAAGVLHAWEAGDGDRRRRAFLDQVHSGPVAWLVGAFFWERQDLHWKVLERTNWLQVPRFGQEAAQHETRSIRRGNPPMSGPHVGWEKTGSVEDVVDARGLE